MADGRKVSDHMTIRHRTADMLSLLCRSRRNRDFRPFAPVTTVEKMDPIFLSRRAAAP